MTQAQAEKQGYHLERYPASEAEGANRGRRYLWRLLSPGGRTLNAGYQSRRQLLAWLEQWLLWLLWLLWLPNGRRKSHEKAAVLGALSNPADRMREWEKRVQRLLDLPGEITQVEERLFAAEQERQVREHAVGAITDRLLLAGNIDGKNAEIREAQLRQALATEPGNPVGRLTEAERLPVFLKRELHRLQNEFASLRAIARLLAAFSSD